MLKPTIAALVALTLLPSCASNSVQNIPKSCSQRDARPANPQGSILLPPVPVANPVSEPVYSPEYEPVSPDPAPPEYGADDDTEIEGN